MMTHDNPDSITAIPACAVSSFVGCLLLVALALFVSRAGAQGAAQDQPICKAVNATDYPENARIAEWAGYPEKWAGYPAAFNDKEPIFLYTDDSISAGYALYFDATKQELWIFPHWSFESRGPTGGTHDLCAVVIYALGDR
jgi:hypothetical protein